MAGLRNAVGEGAAEVRVGVGSGVDVGARTDVDGTSVVDGSDVDVGFASLPQATKDKTKRSAARPEKILFILTVPWRESGNHTFLQS